MLWAAVALAQGTAYAGRPVADVLHELTQHGLRLIYSSETVPDSLLTPVAKVLSSTSNSR